MNREMSLINCCVLMVGLCCLIAVSDAASILLLANPFPSHWSWMAQLGKQLHHQKHEVYAVIRDSNEMRMDFELKDIQTLSYALPPEKAHLRMSEALDRSVFNMLIDGPPSYWDIMKQNLNMMDIIEGESKYLIGDDILKEKLKSMHFDLALVDGSPMNFYLFVIPHVLGVPYVAISPFYLTRTMGLPALPSYHPIPGGLQLSDRMTFPQRLLSTFMFIFEHYIGHYLFFNNPVGMISKYGSESQDIPFCSLGRNSRMWLIQQLQPLDWPKVSLPHVVNIGPLSMRSSKKLPHHLQSWIDLDSKSGLIVFSFGTLNSKLPYWLMSKFLNAFSQLESKVIGRYTGEGCNTTAKNVKMLPWIPQNDLLGHPSTSLFISHCGNGGLYEALYHGVPMLGLPLFGDHSYNCKRIEDRGYGIVLNFTMTTEDLLTAIQDVLQNPEYKKRTKKASDILRRDPQLPMDKAIYWIEYVLEFGADHLRSPALDFRWYKYFCVDTLSTLFIIMAVLIYIFIRIVRLIFLSTIFPLTHKYFCTKQKKN